MIDGLDPRIAKDMGITSKNTQTYEEVRNQETE